MSYDLEYIAEELTERIDEVLDYFNLEYTQHPARISMPCPVHGGDNPGGFNILTKGRGNWRCFTHFCHEENSSLLCLVQHLLSNHTGQQKTLRDAILWSAEFTGAKKQSTEEFAEEKVKTDFIRIHRNINNKTTSTDNFYPVAAFAAGMEIPSPYYLGRGYKPETLRAYMVGDCLNSKHNMVNRAVVPCLDDSGKFVVGYSGRSIFDECPMCNMYHKKHTMCPITPQEISRSGKWKNNSGFKAEAYLYNYWRARPYIEQSMTAIIVEGPGDVWRLHEYGIFNVLCVMGAKFTPQQKCLLECMPVTKLIIATDNDDAGKKIRQSIRDECSNLFNIMDVFPDKKDWGEEDKEIVEELFGLKSEEIV